MRPARFHRRVSRFVVGLLVVAEVALLDGQPPPQPPTFRAGVGAVRLDVTVIGHDGQPVVDLVREDFEVREDDTVQTIQVFERHALTGDPPAGSDESLVIRSPDHARQEAGREDVRLLVVFVDDYHLKAGALEDNRLRGNLSQFIQSEMRPLDLFAVMGPLTPISDLGLTRDRTSLLKRVNGVQGRLGGFVPPRSVLEEAQLRLGGGDLIRIRAQVTLSALESLVVHLGGLREGRKSILFVSQGPPLLRGGVDLTGDLRDVISAANRHNVTVHTLDPRELADVRRLSDANEALAADTGGRRIGLTNDFSKPLRGVMSDATHYYLLGYQPGRQAPDGKFHDIDVRVRRKRVRVIARNGYRDPRPDASTTVATESVAATVPLDVAAALDALREQTRRISISDWIGVSPLEQGTSVVMAVFEPRETGAAAIARLSVERTSPGGITATEHARLMPDGTWQVEFTSPPGRVRLVPTATNAQGDIVDTWQRDVVVPGAETPASRVGTPIVFRTTSVSQYRALRSGSAVTPSTTRRFRRGDRVIVRLPLAADSDAAVETLLLNRQGKVLRTLLTSTQPSAGEVELPLGSLAHSDYLVRFAVTIGNHVTSSLVSFSLIP